MLLNCYQCQWSTFTAPQAAICWSANPRPQIKSSFKIGPLIGRNTSESFQKTFHCLDSWWPSPARASRSRRRPDQKATTAVHDYQ